MTEFCSSYRIPPGPAVRPVRQGPGPGLAPHPRRHQGGCLRHRKPGKVSVLVTGVHRANFEKFQRGLLKISLRINFAQIQGVLQLQVMELSDTYLLSYVLRYN